MGLGELFRNLICCICDIKGRSVNNSLDLARQYESAMQLYTMEVKTIGERNSAFLLTQSILVVAFIQVVINRSNFPFAYEVISLGIGIAGVLFCLSYYAAGLSGAKSAFKIRQLMQKFEVENHFHLFTKLYDLTDHKHKKFKNGCDSCLYERLPLPHSWLINTTIFSVIWCASLVYTCISALIKFNPPSLPSNDVFSFFYRFDKYVDYLITNISNVSDIEIFVRLLVVLTYFIIIVLVLYIICSLIVRMIRWRRNTLYH